LGQCPQAFQSLKNESLDPMSDASSFSTQQNWKSSTGSLLCVRHLQASGKPKASIMISHGMAEHSARYERFAIALADAGYHVYAHDHRGHGFTTAPDAPLGTFSNKDGLEKALQDMLFVNGEIRNNYPDLPVIYFGHSMGGILGTAYCVQHSKTIDAAVLWNFNVDGGPLVLLLKTLIKIERALKGSDVPSLLANKLTFEDWNKKFKPNRTDFDWLSRDEAQVDKYVADPLCGFPVSVGLWLNVIEAIQAGSKDANLDKIRKDLPIHLIGGEADPSSMNGKSMTRLASRLSKAGVQDVSIKTLPDTRHETLNELNRDEETKDLIGWLNERWG
jgi:alpha-beta hydrolase superfamily lysophospholipase